MENESGSHWIHSRIFSSTGNGADILLLSILSNFADDVKFQYSLLTITNNNASVSAGGEIFWYSVCSQQSSSKSVSTFAANLIIKSEFVY